MLNTDACKNDCTDPYCGDGILWQGNEGCDDANMINSDACTNGCDAAACGDGILWIGQETCDDGNQNNGDACPLSCEPAVCGDGFLRTGVEACDDGNQNNADFCSNSCMLTGNGVIWFGSFIGNQDGQSYCDEWATFRTQLQLVNVFTHVEITGSNHPQGVTCDGAAANTICQALGDGLVANNVMCNGRTWNVGTCGAGSELNAQGNGVCQCTNPGYTARPCIGQGNPNWGGVNTATCNGPTQTIQIICG
jgi:cysteine-rich repeat protein